MADEKEAESDAAPQAGAVGGEDHLYQVVGTLKDARSTKPAWVADIIQVIECY